MFHFKHFSLYHKKSTLKIGTDAVLLASLANIKGAHAVLDIGCGCGVIAFCIAFRMQNKNLVNKQTIVGIDMDYPSIEEANENLALFPKKENQEISFYCEKIETFAKKSSQSFDLIVSNPPYFQHSLKPVNEKKLKSKHADNQLHFEDLIASVHQLLSQQGIFYLILPLYESQIFLSLAKSTLFLVDDISIYPASTKPAHRKVLGFSKIEKEKRISSLSIRDKTLQYTEEYKLLTRDFYLDF